MVREIEHITLTTGSTRTSPRDEVADHVVAHIRTSMAEANGRLGNTGWAVKMVPFDVPEVHCFDLLYEGAPVVRCWLNNHPDPKLTDMMWGSLGNFRLPGVKLTRPKPGCWLAVALLPEAVALFARSPGTLMEAGDLERCVAWALLE